MPNQDQQRKLAEARLALKAMRRDGLDPRWCRAVEILIRSHTSMCTTASQLWYHNQDLRTWIDQHFPQAAE